MTEKEALDYLVSRGLEKRAFGGLGVAAARVGAKALGKLTASTAGKGTASLGKFVVKHPWGALTGVESANIIRHNIKKTKPRRKGHRPPGIV